jgi:RNA recognition motif-containing protein
MKEPRGGGSVEIYVGNLAWAVTGDQLRELFAAHGEVASARVIADQYSGRSRGFGFVEMPKEEEARAAIAALNEMVHQGRALRVNEARPRGERRYGSGGGRPAGAGGRRGEWPY